MFMRRDGVELVLGAEQSRVEEKDGEDGLGLGKGIVDS